MVGVGLGGTRYQVGLGLDGSATLLGQTESATVHWSDNAVAPLLTLGYKHAFSDSLRVYANASGVRKNGGVLAGHIVDARVGVEWFPWRNVGLGAEYGRTRIDLKRDAQHYDAKLDIDGVLVAPLAGEGVEVIVGARRDPVFGPIIVIGSGGIYTEVMRDAVIGVLPLVENEARELIRSLRIHPLLDGARGKPKADIGALTRCIDAVSRLMLEHPEIAEIEINPLRVLPETRGAHPLDALMILQEPPQR